MTRFRLTTGIAPVAQLATAGCRTAFASALTPDGKTVFFTASHSARWGGGSVHPGHCTCTGQNSIDAKAAKDAKHCLRQMARGH